MLPDPQLLFCWADDLTKYVLRQPEDIRGVVVHRIEVSQEDPDFSDTPRDTIRFFTEHPIGRQATGGAMPYPLLVGGDGCITQTVPLNCITPHARAHNTTTVAVSLIGDFRRCAPTQKQREQLVCVCAHLLTRFGLTESALHGHDELSEASHDPDKECPGRHLPMDALRQDVAAYLAAGAPTDTRLPFTIQWEKV